MQPLNIVLRLSMIGREKINNFMTVCFIFKETSPKERVSNEENMLKDVENIEDISEKGMQTERYVKRGLKIHVNTERFF